MPAILLAALAGFVVELAKSAGHEAGIQVVAKWGPYLTAEEAGKVWVALLAKCTEHVAKQPGGVVDPPESDSWPQDESLG